MSGLFNIIPATTYFPTTESCSIIGSNRLNYRVRDGNGCDPVDTITGKLVVWSSAFRRPAKQVLQTNFQNLISEN